VGSRTAPWIAFAVLTLTACTSTVVDQCGGCPGSYLDPNGLIRPGDAVASVRVCLDGECRTETYPTYGRVPGQYAAVTGTYPPNPAHVGRIEATTFDAAGAVIRTVVGRSLELPKVKEPPRNSCACSGFVFRYDATAQRFVVKTQ